MLDFVQGARVRSFELLAARSCVTRPYVSCCMLGWRLLELKNLNCGGTNLRPPLPAIAIRLPAVVGERLVGVCHAVRVVLLLDGATTILCCIDELGREALAHRLLAAIA
jgi:hypothetical protein